MLYIGLYFLTPWQPLIRSHFNQPFSMPENIQFDSVLAARWIAPMAEDFNSVSESQSQNSSSKTLLEHHAVGISKGKITAIKPTALFERSSTDVWVDLGDHLLIPGLINAHGHSPMSLFRGMSDDVPLHQWLNDHIWPAEAEFVCEEFVRDGSTLAIAEMIRCGTTCFSDMYFYPEVTAKVAIESKIRCQLATPILEFPSVWAQNADEYIRKGLKVHDDFRGQERLIMAFGPHAPYTVEDSTLNKVLILAEELDANIQMHIHESRHEVDEAIRLSGKSPITRLNELGALSPRLQAVHMTQLLDNEIQLLADSGVNIIHCPESNLKLASGLCHTQKLLDAGINLALGTDGAASNNDLDMISEMRTCALIAKLASDSASSMNAYQTLYTATLGGAKALGIENLTGSIEIGKFADLTAINLNLPELQPVFNPISQLIYSASRESVSDVWVAGQQLLNNRELTFMDLDEIIQRTQFWQKKISLGKNTSD